jgi:hypothetical protein
VRLVITVSTEDYEAIRHLIDDGRYRDVAQFLEVALNNQIELERLDLVGEIGTVQAREPAEATWDSDKARAPGGGAGPVPVNTPSYNDLAWPDGFIWGQINRYLPIKIAIRSLTNSPHDGRGWVSLREFEQSASESARRTGLEIVAFERKYGIGRDERVSTGLPIGPDVLKSMARYRAHFLARANKHGKLQGGLADLRLVSVRVTSSGKQAIGATRFGVKFAQLPNPVIDSNDFSRSLSDAEIDFIVGHISEHVQGEKEGIRWLLRSITEGDDTPERLDSRLRSMKPNWTGGMVVTQRAGLVSRAHELRLIAKRREGIAVTFEVTDRGRAFSIH